MPDSIYKVVQLVGTSSVSWEDGGEKGGGHCKPELARSEVAEITSWT